MSDNSQYQELSSGEVGSTTPSGMIPGGIVGKCAFQMFARVLLPSQDNDNTLKEVPPQTPPRYHTPPRV